MKNACAMAVVGSILTVAVIGCTPKPSAVYRIDNSALPPAAKALVADDARITGVKQAVYAKGGKDYIIDYVTADGSVEQIKYADYQQSQPTYVFERFELPETR